MEARDNSFDLDTIHHRHQPQSQSQPPLQSQPHPHPHSLPMSYSRAKPRPLSLPRQSSLPTTTTTSRASMAFLPRQHSLDPQWLSSASTSAGATAMGQPRSRRELFPLRHQPQSFTQSRSHSQYMPAPRYDPQSHGHAPSQYRYTVQDTSFAHPPRSLREEFLSPTLSKVEAVTHAIRNKIIVEEDEEDILSTDRFY